MSTRQARADNRPRTTVNTVITVTQRGGASAVPDQAGDPGLVTGPTQASVHRLQDRHDLLRRVDCPRIGEGPVVEHAVRGDALQVVALDADVAQPLRQSEACDEAVKNLGGWLAGRAERGTDLRLTIAVDLGVERQHRRQHDAGRVAVSARAPTRDAGCGRSGHGAAHVAPVLAALKCSRRTVTRGAVRLHRR
jgi:hypothetical protein